MSTIFCCVKLQNVLLAILMLPGPCTCLDSPYLLVFNLNNLNLLQKTIRRKGGTEKKEQVCVSSVNHHDNCALAEQMQMTDTSTLRRRNKSRTGRQSPLVSSRCSSNKRTLDSAYGKIGLFISLSDNVASANNHRQLLHTH